MAENSKCVVVTDASFQKEVLDSKILTLVDFWAEWCPPCRALAPKLDKIAADQEQKIKVCKVNADENSEAMQKYKVLSLPTVLFFKNGTKVHELIGNLSENEFLKAIERFSH